MTERNGRPTDSQHALSVRRLPSRLSACPAHPPVYPAGGGVSSATGRTPGRFGLIAAVIAAVIGLGWWIGVQIAHKRQDDRNRAAAERVRERDRADFRRERAADAAEARKERRQKQAESRLDALDDAIERANGDLLRAAKAGRRGDVARAEAAL